MVEGIDGWLPIEKTAPFLIRFGAQPTASAVPWFEHPAILALGLFCCWPVGLTLIWRNPRISIGWKVAATSVPVLGLAVAVAMIAGVGR